MTPDVLPAQGQVADLRIEKATNGHDADAPPGPQLLVGDSVVWTYAVTNTGDVTLTDVSITDDQGVAVSCPTDSLQPGASMTCTGTGFAAVGQYQNCGTATGLDPSGGPASDVDCSHYLGVEPPCDDDPQLRIEKRTNGHDADAAPGPQVVGGSTVQWTYTVTNSGNVDLENMSVTDDQGVAVSCPTSSLNPGQSMTCTGQGTAVAGQYSNVGTATGTSDPSPSCTATTVSDSDPSHYHSSAPELAIDDVTVVEGDAGTTAAVFTVSLSAPSGFNVSVDYFTADGSAMAGTDYAATAGTVVIPAGSVIAAVPVSVLGDLLDEPDETFSVLLSSPVNATLLDSSGLGTILDDDDPPALSIDDQTVTEGDSGTTAAVFTVTLSAASGFDVSVDYSTADGSATAGADYGAAAGTVVIPAGNTSATLSVDVLGDLVDEPDETYSVELSGPVNATLADASGLGTILDDDEAEIAIDDVTVDEGDAGTVDAVFTVTLSSGSASDLQVDYATVPDTATADVDYLSTAGTLVIPAGMTTGNLPVPVVGDLLLEPDETFTVELSAPSAGILLDGVGVGTILDDELCLGPNLIANPGAEEPLSGGELPGWTEIVGANWQPRFADPPPAEGAAYFFAGEADIAELRQDIDLTPYAGVIAAGDQAFLFEAALRAFDELPADTARIVLEYRDATNTVVLDVFDSGEISSPAAWQPVDDLRFAPAGTGWARVRLVTSRLSAGLTADGYFDALSLRSLRTPVMTLAGATVTEGDVGTMPANFELTLSCATEEEVSAIWATTPDTATADVDYLSVPPTPLVLPAGTTGATLPVQVVGDTLPEQDETYFVDLSAVVGAVLVTPRATGLIVDDDGAFTCPRNVSYWRKNVRDWPVNMLEIGGVLYGRADLRRLLRGRGGASAKLARQLVATKLNLAAGSDPAIQPVVDEADAFLVVHPPGSRPRGAAKRAAKRLERRLAAYNTQHCDDGDSDSDSDSDHDSDSDSDSDSGSDSDSDSGSDSDSAHRGG